MATDEDPKVPASSAIDAAAAAVNAAMNGEAVDGASFAFSLLDLDVDDDHLPLPSTGGKQGSQGDSSSANGKSGKGQNAENGNHRGNYKRPLVWIDLEMTGLDVEVDRILEIACIITDGSLTKSVEGPDLIIHQPQECLDKMNEWCQSHHGDSGLTVKVQQSTINESDAEEEVITFVKKHIGNSSPLLAGNSVYVDFAFLKKYMPKLASLFSHVLVDVSSVRSLCIRWFPKAHEMAPAKEKKHRAMEDIRESIAELKYLKKTIFKPKLRK